MKNMKHQITLIQADDWCGLYINGKLATEGHSIDHGEFCEAVGIVLVEKWADCKWLEDRGRLPEKLSDVKLQ